MDGKKRISVDCISDLCGHYPEMGGGDLLLICGNIADRNWCNSWRDFYSWLDKVPYKGKFIIAGNRDSNIDKNIINSLENCIYLEDSGFEFEGLKIWGSPWSLLHRNLKPEFRYFTGSEKEISEKIDLVPQDIDILMTHSPPYGIFDEKFGDKQTGCRALRNQVIIRIKPKLHVFGHILECGGKKADCSTSIFVNSAIVNQYFKFVNPIIRVYYDVEKKRFLLD